MPVQWGHLIKYYDEMSWFLAVPICFAAAKLWAAIKLASGTGKAIFHDLFHSTASPCMTNSFGNKYNKKATSQTDRSKRGLQGGQISRWLYIHMLLCFRPPYE